MNHQKVDFDRIWETCISGRPIRQHLAIVDVWLQENPERWHEPAIELIFSAESHSCDELHSNTTTGHRAGLLTVPMNDPLLA